VSFLRAQLKNVRDAVTDADNGRVIHRIENSLNLAPDDSSWLVLRRADVISKVHKSHDDTLNELGQILARKVKYLGGLKL
jgi:hypothetical protein